MSTPGVQGQRRFSPQDVTAGPGVYVFRSTAGEVIYVGKAKSLRRRLSSYFQPSRSRTADPRLRSLIHSIHEYQVIPVRSEAEALLLESRLIKEYAPRYNVELKDDKRFLLVRITLDEPYPRLVLTRLRRDDGCLYFGPFPHAGVVRETVRHLVRLFGLRSCRVRVPEAGTHRHCLRHTVMGCCMPCLGRVTAEEYRQRVDGLTAVLRGDTEAAVEPLRQRMRELAAQQRFEDAARTRDVIANLESLCDPYRRTFGRATIPADPAAGQGVQPLQDALGLARAPDVIECIDISNLAGRLAVASLVCFRHGRPSPRDYRRFRIRAPEGTDDTAMVAEVVRRRYGRILAEAGTMPDLVMVDGGGGQLSAALRALAAIGAPAVPLLGLAKRQEEVFLPGRPEPLALPRHHDGLKLLQAVRDEAHRFAISYHRELRRKRLADSVLNEIEGVGPVRAKALLRVFGSVRRLSQATAEQIAQRVPGIGTRTAALVLAVLGESAHRRGSGPHEPVPGESGACDPGRTG